MRYLYLLFMPLVIYSQNIRESKLHALLLQQEKSVLESELHKDAWIAPLILSAEYYKSNINDLDNDESMSIGLNLSQDIYRSGGIGYEKEQAGIEKRLSEKIFKTQLQQINITVYEYVFILRVIDLKLKQLNFSIENKKIEILSKQVRYNKGLIDISELDTSMLELSSLKNEIESLGTEKLSYTKELRFLSDKPYTKIKMKNFSLLSHQDFLEKNAVHIKKDEVEHSQLSKKIIASNYLPKVSVVANYKYEDSKYRKNIRNDRTNWNYGFNISMPIDYNEKKTKEIGQLELLLSESKYQNHLDDENIFYSSVIAEIKLLRNRVGHHKKAIVTYDNLIDEVNKLYLNGLKTKEDLIILRNTKESKRQDILIDTINIKMSYLKLIKRLY